MTGMECTRLYDLAPELALGLLDGAERAEVLAHLERCATCHADVASLTELGEQLLLLAPEVPPPAGFETRVLDRVVPRAASSGDSRRRGGARGERQGSAPRHARRRRPSWFTHRVVGAAAAVALFIAAMTGLVVGMTGSDAPQVAATARMVDGDGNPVGAVNLLKGSPGRLQLDMSDWAAETRTWASPPHGPWTLSVAYDNGGHEHYDLPGDDTTPQVKLDKDDDPASIHEVALLDGDGRAWCRGTFT
jgi:hypothetical protein